MSTDLKPLDAPTPRVQGSSVRLGDRIFTNLTRGAGIFVLVLMASIGGFLVWKAIPAFQDNSGNFFTTQAWFPDADPPFFGIAALAFGTFISSVIAMLIAVPIAVGTALFIAYYAARRAATSLGFVIDVLAAVPSIIYGLWGLEVLMNHMDGITRWLNDYLGFIPLFNNEIGIYTKSIFIASVVLAIMILPTISALSREVFLQVPRSHREASLALGATRWEMIRMAVLPFGRPGVISATMLGLGRALGETIAVALILSAAFEINWHITEPGGNTFAANIALKWNEAGPTGLAALIASGLVLFIITLLVNMAARWVIARHKEFSGAN
ncbi:MAG: phosphate ABC transporter permease subunit PstC [Candidatus Nanopelagicales bacterium]